MLPAKTVLITNYQDFRSAFVSSEQRRQFLLDCAIDGFKSILREWPDRNLRFFVFGSTANSRAKIGIHSDLDIAISGELSGITPKTSQQSSVLSRKFREGLSDDNKLISIDIVVFDADNPKTSFAREILENGIEIKFDE